MLTKPNGLLPTTVAALHNRPAWLTFPKIASETGLSERWLSDLANNRMAHPSVVRVQELHDYLVQVTATGVSNAG